MTHHLFDVYGIELEYMIVDQTSLNIKPIADQVFKAINGNFTGEAEFGDIAWSNELALHVIELKTNGPTKTLSGLSDHFKKNIGHANKILQDLNACLLPTGAHPWMNPLKEAQLWIHDSKEIYDIYDTIFNCTGHGWTNLQSMHLNLPFANDEEFALLHSAIRLLLPIIPAITASTPILEGKITGYTDTRVFCYQRNQAKIPCITGQVIPEFILSKKDYEKVILHPIYHALKPYDTKGLLQHEWVNSRGAIARFDRNAIEIRLLDTQECPAADIAIADMVTETLKYLVNRIDLNKQTGWSCERLNTLLQNSIQFGSKALIDDAEYLDLFGLSKNNCTTQALWQHIFNQTTSLQTETKKIISFILEEGNLAERILTNSPKNIEEIPSYLKKTYKMLAKNLSTQTLFNPYETTH